MTKPILMGIVAIVAVALLMFAARDTVRASTHSANMELHEASIWRRRASMLLFAMALLVVALVVASRT